MARRGKDFQDVQSGSSTTAPVRGGVQNDLAERMNEAEAYKPGAGPKMRQGFGNPLKQIGQAIARADSAAKARSMARFQAQRKMTNGAGGGSPTTVKRK